MITVLLGLIVISRTTFSLGMGQIQVDSALDQELDAYIELSLVNDESYEDITVSLASSDDYRKVGLDKSFVPSNIRVSKDEDLPIIRLTSNGPVSEPIVSLLLEVNWENGRLLREYTILLDPPVFSDSTAVSAPIQNVQTKPVENVQMAELTVESADGEVKSFTVEESSPTTEYVEYNGDGVVVNAGDTLWSLANRVNYSDSTTHQMMIALYNSNPDAFLNNNINQLRKGARLRIPTREEVNALSHSSAYADFQQHQSSWTPSTNQTLSTLQQETETEEAAAISNDLDYGVELVGGDDSESSAGSIDSSVENDGTEVIQLEEELTSKTNENQELSNRVNELEEIVEKQQAALEVDDDDLAALQENAGDTLEDFSETVENAGNDLVENVEEGIDNLGNVVDDTAGELGDTLETTANEAGDLLSDQSDDVWGQNNEDVDANDDLSSAENTVASVDVSTDNSVTDISPTTVKPTRKKEESFVDKALGWVKSNLMYVGGGLLALLALLFVPKMLRSSGGSSEEETDFFEDIKANRSSKEVEKVAETVENTDAVSTQVNQPIVDEAVEGLEETLQDGADELLDSELGMIQDEDEDTLMDVSLDDLSTDETEEEFEEDEDEFDLDEFLNQDDSDADNDNAPTTADSGNPVTDELDSLVDEADELEDLNLDDLDEGIDLDTVEVNDDTASSEEEISLDLDGDLESELESMDIDDSLDDVAEESDSSGLDDLMAEEDSVETKLDLAKAYMGMGENEGASSLLDEVIEEGNDAQRKEAESLKNELNS